MLSIRGWGGWGGGWGGLELSYQAYVYLPLFALLVSQLLSRGFGTYLSSHGKVFVALYAIGNLGNRH